MIKGQLQAFTCSHPVHLGKNQNAHDVQQFVAKCHTYIARKTYSPCYPSLQSQSLSRSYGSNLPTSLTYISLSTRDFKPWRPAADSVQSVESLRAPVFDFQGSKRVYRHSNLMPCSTNLSNHISLWKTSMVSMIVKQKRKLFRYLLLTSQRKGFMLPWLHRMPLIE